MKVRISAKSIRFYLKYLLILYFIVQILLIIFSQINYTSDAHYYYRLAEQCIQSGEFYPAKIHQYEDFIVAPLYINVLILLLKIYNSPVSVSIFNLFITFLQILLLFRFTKRIFSVTTAVITIIIYILYLNTLGFVISNYTELFFTFLITAGLYFYLNKGSKPFFLSGIFLGASIAVRPLGWAILLALLIISLFQFRKSRKYPFDNLYIYAGILVFILAFGIFNNIHFGKFIFTSTTGPVNLLLGANDDATGGFNPDVYKKGKAGFLANPDSLTYDQKGDYYYNQALSWIKNHPDKWIALAPLKIVHTFLWDDISISNLFLQKDWYFSNSLKELFTKKDFENTVPVKGNFIKILYWVLEIVHHIFYYILLTAIFIWVIKNIKLKSISTDAILLLMFSVISILIIMITVGTPRYKYPIFILLLPFAANYFENRFLQVKEKNEIHQ